MKKFSRIIFMFLLGLFLAAGCVNANPVQANAATKKSVTTTKKKKVNKKSAAKKSATKIKKWNLKSLKGLKGIVDQDVLDAFNELGFVVTVDKAEAAQYGYTGCFSPSRRKIILKKGDTETLLHETGHFVDFITDYPSASKEFTAIYKAEKKKAKKFYNAPSYTLSSPKEYFAESFNMYYSNPAKLKSKCPKTYKYLEEAIEAVSEESVANIKNAFGW